MDCHERPQIPDYFGLIANATVFYRYHRTTIVDEDIATPLSLPTFTFALQSSTKPAPSIAQLMIRP